MTISTAVTKTQQSNPLRVLLPYLGVILFVVTAVPIWFGDHTGDWSNPFVTQ